jgi:hypothetical protein
MNVLLAVLLFFGLAQPAAACRRFSIWHYSFPEPCPIARAENRAAPAPTASDIPLPDLTEITCAKPAMGGSPRSGSCGS